MSEKEEERGRWRKLTRNITIHTLHQILTMKLRMMRWKCSTDERNACNILVLTCGRNRPIGKKTRGRLKYNIKMDV
jgi:hypothetical protein